MIEQLRSPGGDNYSYVVYDETGGSALLVDPVALGQVQQTLEEHSLTPTCVVNTHGHGDHTAGNQRFLSDDTQLVAHAEEASRLGESIDRTVEHGDTIEVGALTVEVLHTPGHTDGSICLLTPRGLISGDTVFLAGCGNPKFGGNTRKLFESFDSILRSLPDDLTLYPGHDYAARNLKFARSVEPDNPAVDQKLQSVESLGSQQQPGSTIGEEKTYNPFFRYDNPDLIENLSELPANPSDRDVFNHLRERRNQW